MECCQTKANAYRFSSDDGQLGGRKATPTGESNGSVCFEILLAANNAFVIEVIVDGRVRNDPAILQGPHPTKPEHRPLSSSKELVRIICPRVHPISTSRLDGFPKFTPRALATARASSVRREIASRAARAASAVMPTVRSLASDMSTAKNRTPLWRTVSKKAALRNRRQA